MTTNSLFTRIINREIPAEIIFEDDDLIVIKDIDPKAPIHLLAIPKAPFSSIHELLQDEANKDLLWKLYSRLASLAEETGIAATGYRLRTNVGLDGGQTIPHLHIHLLGGDKVSE